MKVLILNAGSSSQKSGLYELADDRLPDEPPPPLWEAQIDWTHQAGVAEIVVKTSHSSTKETVPFESRLPVIDRLIRSLWTGSTQVLADPSDIQVVGHRVVHGGRQYHESTRITPEVKAAIAELIPLAPVHNPANLEGIDAIEQILGQEVPQVAVFDTAFHATMPAAAATYPGPYEWVEKNILRYGFHGTSHQYCAEKVAALIGRDLKELKIITCHLGNGCSLAAIRDGRSVDTTMGFTPLDGLMMGTRSGAVDPSILIYLMRQEGYDADKLDHLLNKGSGLLGISGISNDMRQITAAIAAGNDRAKLAYDLFIHRLQSGIGAMLASLGGLDVLVFTAGIGENAPDVRSAACEPFAFLGLKLDLDANAAARRDAKISSDASKIQAFVIHTQEDWAIARDCWRIWKSLS